MGAWDYGIFDSDCNCDAWAALKEDNNLTETLINTLKEYVIGGPPEYLEVDEAGYIVLSVLLVVGFEDAKVIESQPNDVIPECYKTQILAVLEKNKNSYEAVKKEKIGELLILEASRKNLDMVCKLKTSEIYELWEESGGLDLWLSRMDFLYKALE